MDKNKSGNVLSRVYNSVVQAIESEILFPKAILIILDNDLLKHAPNGSGTEKFLEMVTEDLITSLHVLMETHKKVLPPKAKKFKYPSFLWMVPPTHKSFTDNEKRLVFATVLENTVMKFNEMRFLNFLL